MTLHSNIALEASLTAAADDAAIATLFDAIAAGSAARDRERILPFAEIDDIRAARFGAYRLPRDRGGAGASVRQLFDKVMALAEADSNVAHILRNHFVFVERFAQRPVSNQGLFWQQQVAQGAIFGLANTERAKAQSGDNSATRLTPDADGFRLNGTKFYSTGSIYSDFVIVRAKDGDDRQLTAIIPSKRDGIALDDDWDAAGQRLTGTGTSRFKNVRVEPSEVVYDGEGVAYDLAYSSTLPQLFLTAVNAGILRAVLRDAKLLIKRRVNKAFYHAPADVPAEDPILLKIIGDLAAQVYAAEAVVLAAADAQDAMPSPDDSSAYRQSAHAASLRATKAKIVVDGLVLQAATALFDVGGASSTQREHNLDRHWRNARTVASHNPAHYKAVAVGRYELSGTELPRKGFF